MMSAWSRWLLVPCLMAGLALAACGDDEEEEERPTAAGTVQEEEAAAASGEAFPGVPLPEGAEEVFARTFSPPPAWGAFPGNLVLGAGVDPERYSKATKKEYNVPAPPEEVLQFYREHRDGWDEVWRHLGRFGLDGDFVWTQDGGARVVYIEIVESFVPRGTTSLEFIELRRDG